MRTEIVGGAAMAKAGYWADNYLEKRRTAREAVEMIRPGQRVYIG